MRTAWTITVWALVLILLPAPAIGDRDETGLASGDYGNAAVERLRERMESARKSGSLMAGNQRLFAGDPLIEIYESRGWQPLWLDDDGRPRQILREVSEALLLADEHGLDSAHYHRDRIQEILESELSETGKISDPRLVTDLEILISDALVSLAGHLGGGRVKADAVDAGWHVQRPREALIEHMKQARTRNGGLKAALETVLPDYPEYHVLVEQLALHRSLESEGEWHPIVVDRALRIDDDNPAVSRVGVRLAKLGDLEGHNGAGHPSVFDEELDRAVRNFQARHGLEVDGIAGPRTLAELNTTPTQRQRQLRANLERWRWLPRELGLEHIRVNIAGFEMQVFSDGRPVLTQRVIVGLPYRRTPVFTEQMTYLVLNPSWEVPARLAARDLLPQIQADREYLERMGFAVLQGWGAEERRIDPDQVDWDSLSQQHFPYRLRQAPGPENALGTVKFMFPNRHNVYLHDTPARGLFARQDRAFSSGCIRIEDPLELTDWLLHERPEARVMEPERIRSTLQSGRETTVRLGRAVPVHLLYWTAWVVDGQVQFRRDIYGRDAPLIEALDSPMDSQAQVNDAGGME